MLPDDAPGDAATRLDLVVDASTRMIVDTEAQQRTMLRLSLEDDPAEGAQLPLRQGRAIKWAEYMRWSARALLQSAIADNTSK